MEHQRLGKGRAFEKLSDRWRDLYFSLKVSGKTDCSVALGLSLPTTECFVKRVKGALYYPRTRYG